MSRFLRLVVDAVTTGNADLNEYSIGVDVFERNETFDPRIDPIVRVHARRLRQRLTEYYQTEGKDDPIEIELPARTYLPTVRVRSRECSVAPDKPRWSMPGHTGDSIAVVPFASLSSEKEDEYFAAGLAQELIHELTRVRDLRIVSWSPSGQAASPPDAIDLGRRLSVQAVLVGTVRKAARQVRVSTQLISAGDGSVLWSEIYDVDLEGVIAAQQQLAGAICAALRIRIEAPARAEMKCGTADAKAYQLYCKARHFCGKHGREPLEKCIHHLSQALAIDPDFAAARGALAEALVLMVIHGESAPVELMPKAKTEAARALRCDPTLAEPHTVAAVIAAMYEWNLPAAETEFHRALEMAPFSPQPLYWYGTVCLVPAGRFEEALTVLYRARDLDPLSLSIGASIGYGLYASGRTQEASDHLQEVIELEPSYAQAHWVSGLVYQELGNLNEAITEYEAACELSGGLSTALASLGNVLAVSGQTGRALEILEGLRGSRQRKYTPAIDLALIHAGLGELQDALAWINRAYEERCAWLIRTRADHRLRPLHGNEEFERLLHRIGI